MTRLHYGTGALSLGSRDLRVSRSKSVVAPLGGTPTVQVLVGELDHGR
jgi:hypothetical protein